MLLICVASRKPDLHPLRKECSVVVAVMEFGLEGGVEEKLGDSGLLSLLLSVCEIAKIGRIGVE